MVSGRGLAQPPAQPFTYGTLRYFNTACPAINFHGGGNQDPSTDSYNLQEWHIRQRQSVSLREGSVGAIGRRQPERTFRRLAGNVGVQRPAGGRGAISRAPEAITFTSGNQAGIFNPNGNNTTPKPEPDRATISTAAFLSNPAGPQARCHCLRVPTPSSACVPPATGTCAVPGTYGAISTNGNPHFGTGSLQHLIVFQSEEATAPSPYILQAR